MKIHFWSNSRWRMAPKLDIFKSQQLRHGLFACVEIWCVDALWVRGGCHIIEFVG